MDQFRYPGAQPFSTSQKEIFFGREQDIESLSELIQLEQLIVLFSKSGLGKSSLINAGLLPRLRTSTSYIPFLIRFGAFQPASENVSPLDATSANVQGEGALLLDRIIPQENSLWYFLKSRQIQHEQENGIVLIFDQFEELFTYPEEQIFELVRELAELSYNTIPKRFREVIMDKLTTDKKYFSEGELKILHQQVPVKILFAIRSDQMSQLNKLHDYLPHVLHNCYELEPLSEERAEDAIIFPAYKKDENFLSPTFDYSEQALDKILNFLTQGRSQMIESFQLQILCQSVERKVIDHQLSIVQADDLGDVNSIYKNYYDNQIALIDNEKNQLAARRLIEDGLIFEEEERRLSLYEGQIYKDFNINPDLLRQLVNSHLIRAEPSLKGGYAYELAHDSLVAPILKAKEKRRVEEEKKQTLLALEEEKQRLAKEKRKRNRARLAALAGFLLSFLAIAALWVALSQTKRAKTQEERATQARLEADSQRNVVQRELAAKDSLLQSLYEAHLLSGKNLMQNNQFEQAIAEFTAALDLNPESEEARSLINECEEKAGSKVLFDQRIQRGDLALARNDLLGAFQEFSTARRMNINPFTNQQAEGKLNQTKGLAKSEISDILGKAERFINNNDCTNAQAHLNNAEALLSYFSAGEKTTEANRLSQLKGRCN